MLLKWRLPYLDLAWPLRAAAAGWAWLCLMRRVMRERRVLAQMDARMLADIGLSRAEAEVEASRKPWDIAPR